MNMLVKCKSQRLVKVTGQITKYEHELVKVHGTINNEKARAITTENANQETAKTRIHISQNLYWIQKDGLKKATRQILPAHKLSTMNKK